MVGVRVLVVDDQELFRRTMATVVDETDGFFVIGSAASGEEALAAAARLRPDLVLMDVKLAGIDGREATRRLTKRLADRSWCSSRPTMRTSSRWRAAVRPPTSRRAPSDPTDWRRRGPPLKGSPPNDVR